MKLSICIVTMNRANQLREALESCFACDLPEKTEFVIVDNASTDQTEDVVKAIFAEEKHSFYYEKLAENLGVGGGRNYAFDQASGEYLYFLDDDAVVDAATNPHFFLRATELLDQNPSVVSLTTQIYDTVWKKNRVPVGGIRISEDLFKCQTFCGGSHFLRKPFYKNSPYLPNRYGYEEIPPSLRAINAEKVNAICPALLVIHKPAANKWDYNDEKNHDLRIREIALLYSIKKMMYPFVFHPLLWLARQRRIGKHLSKTPNAKAKVNDAVKMFFNEYKLEEKIKIKTVVGLIKDFGLSAF